MSTDTKPVDLDAWLLKLKSIRKEIREEYLQNHSKPWIIGFSGGKDSTLLLHFILEAMLTIAPDERKRVVYIVCNDTLVESPVFQSFVDGQLKDLADNVGALRVPIEVVRTYPKVEETFWVNLLGKGYPAPNRTFRWCTDRMKIRPTSKFIREKIEKNGEAILLLGVRRSESIARRKSVKKYEAKSEGRLSIHPTFKGGWVYSPIKELTTDEVWITLLQSSPPWGGSYKPLITLYKNALGGECPFVMSTDDAPSCGSNSARFGCWTCTVVSKDSSIESLITAGHEHLEPLANFRNRIRETSENPECRSKIRRNGQPGLGPLTLEARQQLLDELLDIQQLTSMLLISKHELYLIRDQWERDKSVDVLRELEKSMAYDSPSMSTC